MRNANLRVEVIRDTERFLALRTDWEDLWARSNGQYHESFLVYSGAVALLVWQAMKVARERGLEIDFDGVSTAGILKFLAGFGGHLVRRYTFEQMRGDFAFMHTMRGHSRELAKRARSFGAKKSEPAD